MRFDIELLRVLCIFGIVVGHIYPIPITEIKSLAHGGLVVFIVISAYFCMLSSKSHTVLERAKRLLTPCIIWSIIYGAFRLVKGEPLFVQHHDIVSTLLTTPSIHLWYLPFIFFGIIAIDAAKLHVSRHIIGIFSAVIAIILIATAPIWRSYEYITPWGQYSHALPALFIGVFFACFQQINLYTRRILFLGIYVSAFIMTLLGLKGFGEPYFFGLITCLILFTQESIIPESNTIKILSQATFGIYLSHLLFAAALRPLGLTGVSLGLLTFLVSCIAVIIARRYLPKIVVKYTL